MTAGAFVHFRRPGLRPAESKSGIGKVTLS